MDQLPSDSCCRPVPVFRQVPSLTSRLQNVHQLAFDRCSRMRCLPSPGQECFSSLPRGNSLPAKKRKGRARFFGLKSGQQNSPLPKSIRDQQHGKQGIQTATWKRFEIIRSHQPGHWSTSVFSDNCRAPAAFRTYFGWFSERCCRKVPRVFLECISSAPRVYLEEVAHSLAEEQAHFQGPQNARSLAAEWARFYGRRPFCKEH